MVLFQPLMPFLLVLACTSGILGNVQGHVTDAQQSPNIIVILADDLGYGDLGCYGSLRDTTPNIDQLAKEGLRFTDFHSNGAVCSPTRAALLTGRYQQRMGITSALGEGEAGLGSPQASDEITIAAYLKQRGYRTGIVGKWHLGYDEAQNPLNFGFDEFRGMLHGAVDYHSHVNTFGRFDWWHNKNLSDEKGYITHLITGHTVELLEKWKNDPFFLYVAHLAIHFPWQSPGDEAHREAGKKYRDVAGPLNRLGPHSPEKAPEVVRTMIKELDVSVGKIMAKLRELHLDDNTLVFFCSDNGGIVKYRGGYRDISSNGLLRGAKGQLYEGGHRVPAIAWWPGRIGAGRVSDQTALTMDILPTVLELTSAGSRQVHARNALDGADLSGLLFKENQLPDRTLYWQHGSSMAVRSGNWKLIVSESGRTAELFDLEADPGETSCVASDHPVLVDGLRAELEAWHREVVK